MIHCALLIGLVAYPSQDGGSQGSPEELLAYVRVQADSLGESHFADSEIPLELRDFAPPAAPLSVSPAQAASEVLFLSLPEGWFGDWHPAPRRQYLISLSGELEIEVSDGEARKFPPGSIILLEDTSGKGHIVRVVGKETVRLVAVPVQQ
jgi:quercetin dioxygenase-like cupin family protein